MDTSYTATTVDMDRDGFADLKAQLINGKTEKSPETKDIREKSPPSQAKKEPISSNKKYVFTKGDQSLELDDDYEIEFMADKRPTRLTLRELKDRAAGDIAVKNRMHSLAEEKKKVTATFKEFTALAKNDPLGALEYISNKAKEADSEFEYNVYVNKLAEQAEKLGQMDEKERKAWELEKKLKKTEEDLSLKEREAAVVFRKQEMLAEYPEIGDQQFGQMVNAILNDEELAEGLEDEKDVMNAVEDLIQETLTQRDIMSVIRDINPDHLNDNELIFSLSDQLRQNPDLDEEDVRDILSELIAPKEREMATVSVPSNQKRKDVRTLSNKARQGLPPAHTRKQNANDYDALKDQLLDRKKEISRTPLYKR